MFRPERPNGCRICPAKTGQRGVAALLSGERMTIKPAGWDKMHERDAHEAAPAASENIEIAPPDGAPPTVSNVEIAPPGDGPTWVKIN